MSVLLSLSPLKNHSTTSFLISNTSWDTLHVLCASSGCGPLSIPIKLHEINVIFNTEFPTTHICFISTAPQFRLHMHWKSCLCSVEWLPLDTVCVLLQLRVESKVCRHHWMSVLRQLSLLLVSNIHQIDPRRGHVCLMGLSGKAQIARARIRDIEVSRRSKTVEFDLMNPLFQLDRK
jgi:hypothetical protein